jgi:hypothetical protein
MVCALETAVSLYRRPTRNVVMKRRMFASSLALAVVAALGLASPAVAQVQVPFRGTLEGDDQLVVPPPVATVHGIGGGEATHLGRFAYDLQATVDFRFPPPVGVGTLTLTSANGDTLVAGILGSSRPVIPGVVVLVTEEAVIVDGTGRFAGATGSFTIMRLVYQADRFTIGSFEGAISIPGNGP